MSGQRLFQRIRSGSHLAVEAFDDLIGQRLHALVGPEDLHDVTDAGRNGTGVIQRELRASVQRVWRSPLDMVGTRVGSVTYPKLSSELRELSAAERFEWEAFSVLPPSDEVGGGPNKAYWCVQS